MKQGANGGGERHAGDRLHEMLRDFSPGIRLGFERYGEHNEVFLFTSDRYRHEYVIAPSGSGKTNLLVHQAIQDINNHTPIMFFDPGNAADQILAGIDSTRLDDIVLVDLSDPDCLVNLNFMDIATDDPVLVSRVCEDALVVLKGNVPDSWAGARFEQKVRAALMTILDPSYPYPRSILDVGKLIIDKGFRTKALSKSTSDYVRNAWRLEDETTRSLDYGEVNQWVYSKFDIFDTNTKLRQLFGPGKPSIDIEQVMIERKTLLVKMEEGVLGQKLSDIVSRYLSMQVRNAVLRRSLVPEDDRHTCILYFDEFQRFVNEAFSELLSEARKYRVGLVVSHQNLRQLTPFNRRTESYSSEVLESVLSNAGTFVAFRPSAKDALILSGEFDVTVEQLRQVPKYCATVRLMSDGEAMEPVVVAVAKPLQRDGKDNIEYVRSRMLASGIWLNPGDMNAEDRKPAATDSKPEGKGIIGDWLSRRPKLPPIFPVPDLFPELALGVDMALAAGEGLDADDALAADEALVTDEALARERGRLVTLLQILVSQKQAQTSTRAVQAVKRTGAPIDGLLQKP